MVNLQTLSVDRKGQTAIEWMTIAAIFVIAVALVFTIFGDEILNATDSIIDTIFGDL